MKHSVLKQAATPQRQLFSARLSDLRAMPFAGLFELLDFCHVHSPAMQVQPDSMGQASSWVLEMRSEQKTKHKLRNYLWIRRPVHRPGRMHRQQINQTLGEIKAIPTLVLFASFISIAICLSIFVH